MEPIKPEWPHSTPVAVPRLLVSSIGSFFNVPTHPSPKPWPIKWVALTIVVFITLYTFLTLHYRRREPPYQPYHDTKERIAVSRLQSAGYQRIFAAAERPADPNSAVTGLSGSLAAVTDGKGGLDAELQHTLLDQPELSPRFSQVRAPREAAALLPYSLQFTCALADNKHLLSGAYVYVKDQEVVIVPNIEKIEGDLAARTPESIVQVNLPAGALAPGNFHFTLVGKKESKQWDLLVH
jgi:hypothetical protein